jgi:hypothetical protein
MARLITPEEREQIAKEVKQELLANPEELWNLAENGGFKKIVRARTYERIAKKQAELCIAAVEESVLPGLKKMEEKARDMYRDHDVEGKTRKILSGIGALAEEIKRQLEKPAQPKE